jgi:glutathione S-transferase
MTDPPFIVHAVPGSPFVRAVLAALEEKGAPYRAVAVPPGGMRAQPHIGRHPFGRVPVLEHDGFLLYETQAILRYLDRVLPEPKLTPADPKAAARMDQVMNISDWYLFQGVGNVIGFHRIVAPRLLGQAPDETAIRNCMGAGHRVMSELARLLGDQPYFAGAKFTLADLLVCAQLEFLRSTPEWTELAADRSKLATWLDRVAARPSMQATSWERVAALVA